MKNTIVLLFVSFFCFSTAWATSAKYDPVCVADIERNKTEVAENTIYNDVENILIIEFEDKYVMIKVTAPEKIEKIVEELDRDFTPVGTIVKSGGEDWIAVYTAVRTNEYADALACAPVFIIKADPSVTEIENETTGKYLIHMSRQPI